MSNPTHRKALARRFAAATGRPYAAALEIVRRAADAGRLPQPLDAVGIEQALATLLEMEQAAPQNGSPSTQQTNPAEWPTFGTCTDGTRAALTGHMLAVGQTGSGKSVMLRALAADAMRLGWAVEVIDIFKMGSDYFEHLTLQATGAHPEGRFTVHTSMAQATEVANRLDREAFRRLRLLRGGVEPDAQSPGVPRSRQRSSRTDYEYASVADLPVENRPPRILLIVDEWAGFVGSLPYGEQTAGGGVLSRITTLAATGRSTGIHVVLASQHFGHDEAWQAVATLGATLRLGSAWDDDPGNFLRGADGEPVSMRALGPGYAVWSPQTGPAMVTRIDPALGAKPDAPATEPDSPAETGTAEAPLPMHPVDIALLAAKTAADRRIVKHPTDQRIWDASWAYEHLTGRQGLVYVSSPGEGADRYVVGDGEEIVEAYGGYTALGRVDAERHILARLDALRQKPDLLTRNSAAATPAAPAAPMAPVARCESSSWRDKPDRRGGIYGPGAYNRCVKAAGHAEADGGLDPHHLDEWGTLFTLSGPNNPEQRLRSQGRPTDRFKQVGQMERTQVEEIARRHGTWDTAFGQRPWPDSPTG